MVSFLLSASSPSAPGSKLIVAGVLCGSTSPEGKITEAGLRECEIRSPKSWFPTRINQGPPRSHNMPPTGIETGPPQILNEILPRNQEEGRQVPTGADAAGIRCSPLIPRPSSAAAAPFWRTKRLRRLHATAKLVALSPGLADAAIAGCLTSTPAGQSKSPRRRLQLLRPGRALLLALAGRSCCGG